ncbi:hypothetical protein [Actinoallomurus rhizosphaericola]|uniref:hypothetical protein n=1 Tax=Actinoallomurus rhizosphaericola TaxID=2952536 RepID=UPI002092B9EB|nr:hypothetical protein [Actinoallomurus rhizosphaericola]MCO5995473.1 hypothetical protein [Actinoallomurus rhizosphaericola]
MGGTGRAVLAAGVVLAAAGCGGGGGGSGTVPPPGAKGGPPTYRTRPAAPPAVPPSGVPVPPTGPTPPPWPVPPTGPTAPPWPVPRTTAGPGAPLPRAANGTDLKACRTGRCEVQVSPRDRIPVPARLGVNELTVTAIHGDDITLRGTAPGTSLTVELGGNAGATTMMNGLAITLVAIADGRAVLRVAPAPGR